MTRCNTYGHITWPFVSMTMHGVVIVADETLLGKNPGTTSLGSRFLMLDL